MIDLWTLLVVDLFQGFWPAIIGLSALMWIMFVIGKVSQVTTLNFLSIFILAMCIGYGYSLISIVITLIILIVHLLAIPRMINS